MLFNQLVHCDFGGANSDTTPPVKVRNKNHCPMINHFPMVNVAFVN